MPRRLFFCFALCLFSSAAHAYCIENWACIRADKSDTGLEFWASNKKAFTITVTVDVTTSNLQSHTKRSNRHTNTLVLAGYENKLILKLEKVDTDRPYRFNDRFHWTPGNMHAKHDNPTYQLPYATDKHYRIVQGFGGGFSHRGASRYAIDIAMPVGTPIHAARGGMVIDLVERHNKGGASRRFAKYANFITIQHSDGTTGEYYHLSKNGALVQVGENVETGQHIGYSGNTGFSSLPHLHFAVYRAKSFGNYESLPFRFAKR